MIERMNKRACPFRKRLSTRLRNTRGGMNIAIVGLTLPIIIMVGIAASDIVRIVISKQQLYAALQSASDHLLTNIGYVGQTALRLHGRNRCAIVPDNLEATCNDGAAPKTMACKHTNPPTCTGTGLNGTDLGWKGKNVGSLPLDSPLAPVQRALLSVEEDVNTGTNKFFDFGPLSNQDLSIIVAVYSLIVKDDTAGSPADSQTVVGKQLLETVSTGPYAPNINTDAIIEARFVTPGNIKAGSIYGYTNATTPNATHVTVAVIWAAYRVNHIFSFPSWLQLGIAPIDKGTGAFVPYGPSETYISASVIKPLPYNIRLDS